MSFGYGVLLIDKPQNMTSHNAVGRVRRLFDTREVGHTGTLDPMATGLLILLIGRAVKASEYFCDGDKRYTARMRLGLVSDTEDIWGKVESTDAPIPDGDAVISCSNGFMGDIMQVPPMYSALKRDGQKLVDIARSGKTVEREARPVRINSLTVTADGEDYVLDVSCSKGTYIRTLCADIGEALGCGAVMSGLRRTEACGFTLSQAHTFEALEEMSLEERYGLLLPVETAFPQLERVFLADFFAGLAKRGNQVYQKKIGTHLPDGSRVLLFDKDGFFAFGEVRKFPEGSAIKPIKQIKIEQ
ncbi:MAG: tRNA pseudouridine(55) synthase TruB [Clostridia bacterium]|nr:tRNA pseudouridine(55) synthase TruB [Clostridia bacterium]